MANVCVIAATNRDIEAEVQAGRFREDLFYRLNVFRLHVPPLRERREDIPELVQYLSERFFKEFDLPPKRFTEEAIATLRRFQWPGNVRQLDHYIQQAIVMSDSEVIDVEDLPAGTEEPPQEPLFLQEILEQGVPLEEVERQLILAALQRAGGNQSQAARLLGVSRRKLQYRMEKHGLYEQFSRRRGGPGRSEREGKEEE
ncbi:MAG: hypothetical protein KatS3mg115_1916 [Candidatus Poribacteria bacterium]|nr:MAG: hypothetical protein KatS3mg115_1916 [Candidatus Poribacteria bacterium]